MMEGDNKKIKVEFYEGFSYEINIGGMRRGLKEYEKVYDCLSNDAYRRDEPTEGSGGLRVFRRNLNGERIPQVITHHLEMSVDDELARINVYVEGRRTRLSFIYREGTNVLELDRIRETIQETLKLQRKHVPYDEGN